MLTRQSARTLLFVTMLAGATLVLVALPCGRSGREALAHPYTHPGSGNTTHLHIDADITNGTRPCDPLDDTASVPLDATHQVGVCLEDYVPNSVEAFELYIHYTGDPDVIPPTTLNVATEIADVPPALDDNPDANDGDDPAGFRLGSGWDCTAFGIVFPAGEDQGTPNVADARIVCNAAIVTPDADLTANPGLLATIEFTATRPGTDTIDFGPIDVNNNNAVVYPLPGDGIARCGTAVPADQIGCFGATIEKEGIRVDSTADTNARDGVVTLREAMLLATGVLTVGELDGSEADNVGGTPGAGSADTIVFDAGVFPPGTPATITLGSSLPTLSTGNDTVDGSEAGVIVDGVSNAFMCFGITSNGNAIKGLEISNCYEGIAVYGGAQGNTIGGSTAGERNVVSGNVYGINIWGAFTDGNVVKGNYIGTDATGGAAFGNEGVGVLIDVSAENNTIGGSTTPGQCTGDCNVISGNTEGIMIDGGASGNTVKGNYIGIAANGTHTLGGTVNGIYIGSGAQSNIVGGTTPAERNIISGNSYGIAIHGTDTTLNTVKGNYIGTDPAGVAALPNGIGVHIATGTHNNTVGGSGAGEGNVISGNSNAGANIMDIGTDGNTLEGNYIGTDANGTAALPNGTGVRISNGAKGNAIGGPNAAQRNLISGNNDCGVCVIDAGTNSSVIEGNHIGTDASGTLDLGNDGPGVGIDSSTDTNVSGNTIAFNTGVGVGIIGASSEGNTISGNSFYQNGALAIDLGDDGVTPNDPGDTDSGPNGLLNFPDITSVELTETPGEAVVTGSVGNPTCKSGSCGIQVYKQDTHPDSVREGRTVVGWGMTTAPFGQFSVAVSGVEAGDTLLALTHEPTGSTNTSEFSHPAYVSGAWLKTDVDPRTPEVDASVLVDIADRTLFDVDVVVEDVPSPGLKAFQFDLTYDDSLVRAGILEVGPFLGSGGRDVSCSVASADVDPVQGPGRGRARLACESSGAGWFPTGDGVVATVPFQVYAIEEIELIQMGTVNFALDGVSLLNGDDLYFLAALAGGTATITGQIKVTAGTAEQEGFQDGPAEDALLDGPHGLARGSDLHFADTGNDRVRKLTLDNQVVTVAGGGAGCTEPCPATDATLNAPRDVALDSLGNVYIADTGNHRIRMVDKSSGDITTVAGTGTPSYNGDNIAATSAQLSSPSGVAVDKFGNVYIADTGNHRIRKVVPGADGVVDGDPDETITTVAGDGTSGYDPSDEGVAATAASLYSPHDVAFVPINPSGVPDPYVIADTDNQRIRKVDVNGIITTLAGDGTAGYGGDGGAATNASLNYPQAVAADDLGQVYIADTENNVVRKVDPQGIINTVAGNGTPGSGGAGGPATDAQLDHPAGISVGSPIDVSSTGAHTLEQVAPSMGEPVGVLPTMSGCRLGFVATGDWLLALLPLGLILVRRRLGRGLWLMSRGLCRVAGNP